MSRQAARLMHLPPGRIATLGHRPNRRSPRVLRRRMTGRLGRSQPQIREANQWAGLRSALPLLRCHEFGINRLTTQSSATYNRAPLTGREACSAWGWLLFDIVFCEKGCEGGGLWYGWLAV